MARSVEYKGHSVMGGSALYQILTEKKEGWEKTASALFSDILTRYNQLALGASGPVTSITVPAVAPSKARPPAQPTL